MNYDLTGKVIIITGANSGIGKEAAIQLAQCNATVVMACRSEERGRQAQNEVKQASQNDNVKLMLVDLASQSSIRHFVEAFKSKYQRLDVLINNAANFDYALKKATLTEDNVETIFATNHIGPFLLTNLLLDLLKTSAPSRVINVASKGLMTFPNLDIEFDNLNGERKFSPQHAYYLSKQAQVMFTYDLAQRLRGTGVTVNCIRVTNVAIPDDRLTHLPKWLIKFYHLKRKMAISPARQAETYTFLAADPSVKEITGGYWDENNQQVSSNKNSYKVETQQRLWLVSERISGISK